MLDFPPTRLVPKGNPTDPRVVLYPQAYSILLRFTRISMPAATVAVLLGRVGQAQGNGQDHETITVEDAYPIRLPQGKRTLVLEGEEIEELSGQRGKDRQNASRIVGWCYIDSGEPGPRSEVDVESVARSLLAGAEDAGLLLLANLASDEGAFYNWRNDHFEAVTGFFELLPDTHSASAVPWAGHITLPDGLIGPDVLPPTASGPAAGTYHNFPQVTAADRQNGAGQPVDDRPVDTKVAQEQTNTASAHRDLSSEIATPETIPYTPAQSTPSPALPTGAVASVIAASPVAASQVVPTEGKSRPRDEGASDEESELAARFDEGLRHYDSDQWAAAQQAFGEVVRRRHDYERQGRSAAKLLELSELFGLGLAAYRRRNWAEAHDLLAMAKEWRPDDERHREMAVRLLAEVDARLSSSSASAAAAAGTGSELNSGDEDDQSSRPDTPVRSKVVVRSLLASAGLLLLIAVLLLGPMHTLVFGFGPDHPLTASALPLSGSAPSSGEAPTSADEGVLNEASPIPSAAGVDNSSAFDTASTPAPSAGNESAVSAPTAAATAIAAQPPPELPAAAQGSAQAPTLGSSAAPSPTIAAPAVEATLRQLAAAESALHSGTLAASIGGSQGSKASNSTAEVRFDLGNDGRPPRYYLKTTYKGDQSSQVREYLMIGTQSWQRVDGGDWVESPPQEAPWAQVQSFLPDTSSVTGASLGSSGGHTTLRWYDAGQNSDVTVELDPATSVPLSMERVYRGANSRLQATYTGWNRPVTIKAPSTSR